jgi:hypothetical protein
LFIELEEILPESFRGGTGDGDGAKSAVEEEIGFVGLVV